MLVAKIQAAIKSYVEWLQDTPSHPHIYKLESLQVYKENWNLESGNPSEMFDRSFYNTENRRLWQNESWQPKRVMMEFWKSDPMSVRLMFQDLFNETKSIDGRIGRFLFGCDMLLHDFRRAHVGTIENNHYHEDYKMIALYLGFEYPETYAPYDFEVFQGTLTYLGAKDIPQQHDLPRYFKMLNTLQNFLDKEDVIETCFSKHRLIRKHYMGKTRFLVEDFCVFIHTNLL